jgi:hypothetical protein
MRKRVILLSGLVVVAIAVAGCAAPSGGTSSPSSTPALGSSTPRLQSSTPEAESPSPEANMLWPAPSDPLDRTVDAGLEPATQEFLTNHVHAHLDVFVDGKLIVVPAGIGINIDDPEVREFDEPDGSVTYGGIEECAMPCISPLHTHDSTGIIHTESESAEPNTLGEFFTEWGVDLSPTCVGEYCSPQPIAFYVDGRPYTEDPRAMELTDRKVIVVVIGTPPAEIPSTADFSKA